MSSKLRKNRIDTGFCTFLLITTLPVRFARFKFNSMKGNMYVFRCISGCMYVCMCVCLMMTMMIMMKSDLLMHLLYIM